MFDPRATPKGKFFVIAGPCVIESLDQCLLIARHVKGICDKLGLPYIFKASFDKANRSSVSSFRGPGMADGLAVLKRVKEELSIPVLTDIHEPDQALPVSQVVDVIQIPAFLARQTDLLAAAGHTGKIINIKKGQFMSPQEMALAAQKVQTASQEPAAVHGGAGGPSTVMLTDRGTFFGYNRLVNDFTCIPIMAETGCPVIFDATHSTQQPAGLGNASGGNPKFSPLLARAAIASGANGLFLECHPTPAQAKSDASTVLPLETILPLLSSCADIAKLRSGWTV